MRHVWDPTRNCYRTERPRAGWFTYLLMFVLAFMVGAGGGVLVAFRLSSGIEAEDFPSAFICVICGQLLLPAEPFTGSRDLRLKIRPAL